VLIRQYEYEFNSAVLSGTLVAEWSTIVSLKCGKADIIASPTPEQIDHFGTGCFYGVTLNETVYYHGQH
jgi:hypothetical protein